MRTGSALDIGQIPHVTSCSLFSILAANVLDCSFNYYLHPICNFHILNADFNVFPHRSRISRVAFCVGCISLVSCYDQYLFSK